MKEEKERREREEDWKGEGQKTGGGDRVHMHVHCLMHTWIKWHSCAWQNEQLQQLQVSTNGLSQGHIVHHLTSAWSSFHNTCLYCISWQSNQTNQTI